MKNKPGRPGTNLKIIKQMIADKVPSKTFRIKNRALSFQASALQGGYLTNFETHDKSFTVYISEKEVSNGPQS